MEEIEVPLEQTQEHIQHAAHHSEHNQGMMTIAALLSAFLAVAAAITALFAGHWANEAMIEQIKASDQWAYYQAKGIKSAIAQMQNDVKASESLQEKIKTYKEEQEQIKEKATELENESHGHLHGHEGLAAAVTIFQVSIALTAIAVLTKKRNFLFMSGAMGIVGIIWAVKTFLLH